jgi:hypothetical protein
MSMAGTTRNTRLKVCPVLMCAGALDFGKHNTMISERSQESM